MESLKLLFDGKYDYYNKNNKSRPLEVEYRRINNISNTFHINGLYYSLDHGNYHNIFDVKDYIYNLDNYDEAFEMVLSKNIPKDEDVNVQ